MSSENKPLLQQRFQRSQQTPVLLLAVAAQVGASSAMLQCQHPQSGLWGRGMAAQGMAAQHQHQTRMALGRKHVLVLSKDSLHALRAKGTTLR